MIKITSVETLLEAIEKYKQAEKEIDAFNSKTFKSETERAMEFEKQISIIANITAEFDRLSDLAKLLNYITSMKETDTFDLFEPHRNLSKHMSGLNSEFYTRIVYSGWYNKFETAWKTDNEDDIRLMIQRVSNAIIEDGDAYHR